MGLLPYYRRQGPGVARMASFISNYFNQKLAASLPQGVLFYDTAALFRDIVANPGRYQFNNVIDPCYDNGQICAQPDQYLFWDGGHPSAHAHRVLGQKFAAAGLECAGACR